VAHKSHCSTVVCPSDVWYASCFKYRVPCLLYIFVANPGCPRQCGPLHQFADGQLEAPTLGRRDVSLTVAGRRSDQGKPTSKNTHLNGGAPTHGPRFPHPTRRRNSLAHALCGDIGMPCIAIYLRRHARGQRYAQSMPPPPSGRTRGRQMIDNRKQAAAAKNMHLHRGDCKLM
jgi:hypothetical protein